MKPLRLRPFAWFSALFVLFFAYEAHAQGFVSPPSKGSCDPRNCHEAANCLVDGGGADISISPKQVSVGETITITATPDGEYDFKGITWPAGISGPPTSGRGGKFIRWQSETMCGGPRPYPSLTRVGNCAGQNSCEYRVTSAGSMEEDEDLGGRPWVVVRLDFSVGCCVAWDEDYFGIVGEKPTAEFSFEVSDENPLEVYFDASDSSDPEGPLEAYRWDFDGDGTIDEETENATLTHLYEEEGTFNVRLVVRDGEGQESDPFTDAVEVKAARMRYVVELEVPSEEEGNKEAQDGERVEVPIGADVLVRVTVENTGLFPLEDVQVAGNQQGVEIISDPAGALAFTEGRQLSIARLEPGAEGEIVMVHEAVHVAPFTVSVAKVQGTAVNPNTSERKPLTEEAATCEAGNKTLGSAQDDPEDNKKQSKGCVQGEVKPGELVVNSVADFRQKEGSDPERDGCTTGGTIVRAGEQEAECTLRAALEVANARVKDGDDVQIRFDIPGSPPHGIDVGGTLVVEARGGGFGGVGQLTIDATPEGGGDVFGGPAAVALGGSGLGLDLQGPATVRGLMFTRFSQAIRLTGGSTVEQCQFLGNGIGGVVEGEENTVQENAFGDNDQGIVIQKGGRNSITGNRIGTNAEGTAGFGNQVGVFVNQSENNTIADNVISGNAIFGIRIADTRTGNFVRNNRIGTDVSGTIAIPNHTGIGLENATGNNIENNVIAGNTQWEVVIFGTPGDFQQGINNFVTDNHIGANQAGTMLLGRGFVYLSAASKNTISGNLVQSIEIDGGERNTVQGNLIGTQRDGTLALTGDGAAPGSGIRLTGTEGNDVLQNTIAFKSWVGVVLDNGARNNRVEDNILFLNRTHGIIMLPDAERNNTLHRNAIYANGGLGIDLGNDGVTINTPNYFGNGWPRTPSVWGFYTSEGTVQVQGVVPTLAVAGGPFTVDVYATKVCDPTGFGEGEQYLGTLQAPAASLGANFEGTVTAAPAEFGYLTATSTDENGGTSEFGRCRAIARDANALQISFDPEVMGTVMDENGVRVTTTGTAVGKTSATATLYSLRYDTQPPVSTFAGSARSNNGSLVSPGNALFRYYYLITTGLTNAEGNPLAVTYDLCLDATGQTSGSALDRLVLLQRNEETNLVWMPHDTHLEQDGSTRYACATGLTSFGEFSFGLGTETTLAAPTLVLPEDGATDVSEMPTLMWDATNGALAYDVQVSPRVTFDEPVFQASGIAGLSMQAQTEGPGMQHYWRVRGITEGGAVGPWSVPRRFLTSGTSVDAEDAAAVPADYVLEANYPNPFNPQTTIGYSLPQATEVRLVVYDALGREVAVLAEGLQPTGRHEVVFEAGDLPSGVYLYRLDVAGRVLTGRMVLLK